MLGSDKPNWEQLMPFPDIVVVLPGISGSVLVKDGREIWGTSTGAIWRALSTGGASIKALGLTATDDPHLDDLGDGVTATRLIPDLHIIPGLWKIDGYSAMISRLQSDLALELGRNLFEFPYDWRRDNRVSARRLQRLSLEWLTNWRNASGNRDAKLVLVAHSMGGLVSRYFLEVLEGWKNTRALVSFGTPYRGSLNALGYLANGYAKGIGPLKVDLSKTLSSFTSVYQLLPAFECVDMGDGKLLRVGEAAEVPGVDEARAKDALAFYREMREARDANVKLDEYKQTQYQIFPIVGVAQPTFQSASVDSGRLTLLQTLKGKDNSGDGTVPRVSATPLELSSAHREIFVSEAHASLQNFDAALVNLTSVLTGTQIDLGAVNFVARTLSLDVDDVYAPDAITIRATPSEDVPVSATLTNTSRGQIVQKVQLTPTKAGYQGTVTMPDGTYRITATAEFRDGPVSVTDAFMVVNGQTN
jgi:hypothetical protein